MGNRQGKRKEVNGGAMCPAQWSCCGALAVLTRTVRTRPGISWDLDGTPTRQMVHTAKIHERAPSYEARKAFR